MQAKQIHTSWSPKRILYSKKMAPYIFVAPFIASFLIFFLYPSIETIRMSFMSMEGFGKERFVGFHNYARLFNYHFGHAILTNTIYTGCMLVIMMIIPIVLAVIVNSKLLKLRNMFRAAFFIPSLVSALIAGIAFRLMFSDMDSGLFNQILHLFGKESIAWNMGYSTGILMMVTLDIWKSIGINMVYCLSALQSIPEDIYESAEIDGASAFRKFWNITVPMLKPTLIYIFTLTVIAGYRMFTESYVYWVDSTPGDIGLTIVRYLYQMSFQRNDMGFGSAIGIVLLAIIMMINLIQLRGFGMFGKEKD
ncbi:carbohydrate ABC transporter permease [Eisenbergiella tayi]|uniref:L-arabinose transport system permease protein AraP n=1 Tax=Eisenbergiella tayi TaxID=1432052 RepID=A0A1E3A732_9FIRM|nr:sugar ABC transporter permease [Eisenbergiella tayi]ODM04570.1 L-arabinose transport system permease protein AraP [Eisenbergiella tayi]